MFGKQRGSKKSSTLKEDSFPEAYAVEKIVDNRINKGKVQYKVHWEGYNTEEDTWENESQLDCLDLLVEYLANEQSTEVSNLWNEDASKNSNSSKKSKKSRGQDKRAVVKTSKSEAFTDESEDEAPKPKTPRRLDKRAANKSETSPEESEDEAPKSKSSHGQDKKGRNKSEDSAKESGDDAAEEYEVEKIVDNRINKGKVQYKVHWEGYNTEEDTWENESQLDCQELLEEYLANEQSTEVSNLWNEDASKNSNSSKKSKKSRGQDKRAVVKTSKSEAFTDESEDEAPKPKTPRRLDKRAANKSETSPEESEDEAPKSKSSHGQDKKGRNKSEDSAKESGDDAAEGYEVEKIVDNRINKGKVQYKVHWEGYNTEEDTWENESQLDCLDLLVEYLANEQSTEVSNLWNEDASKNSNSSKKSKKSRGQDKRAVVKTSKSEAFTDESEDEAPKPKTPRRLDKRAANKSETSPEESEDEAPKSKSSHGQDKKGRNKSEDSAKESGDDAAEGYDVEKIVDNRINKGKVQYKVHWEGYNTEEDTWENESQLDCLDLLVEYLANEQSTEVSNLWNEDASKNSNSSKKSKKSRGQDKRAVVKTSKSEAFTDESEDEAPKPKTPRRLDKRAANKSETSPEESEDEAPKSKSSHGQDKKGRNKSEDSAKESGDDAAEGYDVS